MKASWKDRDAYNAEYYQANRERILAQKKAYNEAHPLTEEEKQKERAWHRMYRQSNGEVLRARQREYRANNKERCAEIMKASVMRHHEAYLKRQAAYRKAHREELNAYFRFKRRNSTPEERAVRNEYGRAYQARKMGAKTDESAQAFYVYVRSRNRIRCYYCGKWMAGKSAHIDHIVALSRQGNHASDNLCASCPKCNRMKQAKLPSELPFVKQVFLNL